MVGADDANLASGYLSTNEIGALVPWLSCFWYVLRIFYYYSAVEYLEHEKKEKAGKRQDAS